MENIRDSGVRESRDVSEDGVTRCSLSHVESIEDDAAGPLPLAVTVKAGSGG